MLSTDSDAGGPEAADTEMKELRYLPVASIERNSKNPRIHFPEDVQQRLTQSIAEKGVLVPVAVFKSPSEDGKYILIDGERRWLCCQDLGLDSIPAVIREIASETEILLEMFNIHMVREQWSNMPTAWALRRVVDETGTTEPAELSRITGLSTDQIRRLLHALELPDEYQRYIDTGNIPLNFFWELKTRVIDPIAKLRPALWQEFEANEVMESFVGKRLANVITDVVSLRKVQPIINIAAQLAGDDPNAASPLDDTIRDLVRNIDTTIDDAYEDSVEVAVESERLMRKSDRLVRSFSLLWDKATAREEKQALQGIARKLIDDLESLLDL
jgi:ParB family chromosome partitioning protein